MKSRLQLCSSVLLSLLIKLLLISYVICVEDSGATHDTDSCQTRNFLIISTVDGVVTALDINTGKKCWSVVLDSEKFLSSSLSEVEIYENGRRIWLVPSLDGGLYKYDNLRKVIQPLPVDVDSLISHSMYFDSSTSVIGGKIKVLYGVNRLTGEIIYVCKMDGCNSIQSPLPQNILIIEEITQYANAIDSSKAEKKWHFRVSELSVKLSAQVPSDTTSTFHNGSQETALIPRNYREFVNVDIYKISLQNGFAGMINKTTQDFSWSFKAPVPITDAWYVKDSIVKILDPFDKESGFFSVEMDDGQKSALLFLGTFENQMFIKKSKNFPLKDTGFNSLSTSVLYQTYIVPVCPKSETHVAVTSTKDLVNASWDFNATDYGSYFYLNYSVAENGTHCIINASYIVQYQESLKLSYRVLGIYITASILTCLIFFVCLPLIIQKILKKEFDITYISSKDIALNEDGTAVDKEFRSRFHQDFEFLSTLGRGGFGVVMDVKNKIDDCRYAVKRIRLHDQLNNMQYEKVLREVKALAKLDHHGIVRYFNAWTEYPPIGWQEAIDKEFNIRDCTESQEISTSSDTQYSESNKPKELSSKRKKTASNSENVIPKSKKMKVSNFNLKMKLNQNPLMYFEDNLLNNDFQFSGYSSAENSDGHSFSSSDSQSSLSKTEQSSSDEQRLSDDDSSSEASHDHSYVHHNSEESNDSFSIVFKRSDNEMSGELIVLPKETDSKNSHESTHNKSAFIKDDSPFQAKCSPKHVKCRAMLRSLNDKLVSCRLNLEVFDVLCAYFFHDESITGISVLERSDWKKAINEGGVVDKISFQQWLICILCLIRSSNDFMCSLLIMNLCCILSDVSKSLNDIHNVKNGFTLHNKQPLKCRKRAVQFSKKVSEFICSSKQELSSNASKSNATTKSSKEVPRGYLYIQMQLCQKESLRDWLDHHCDCREYNKVMEIFSQIVEAVHYVHNCGLMHRDLKPSNIYFSLEGAIKVGDFGLATSSEIHEASVNNTRQSFTHTSDIGTEIYMSPEQKQKQDYDFKTDIYSLGIILFELLVPFKTTSERYRVLLLARERQFPGEFTEQYAKESELVSNLLDDDPACRPTTDEIKQNLLLIKYTKLQNE